MIDLSEADMLVDLLADRIADEREMLARNPGLVDVWKFAADKQAQATAAESAAKWLSDPATLKRLRAIGEAPPEPPQARSPRLRLGGAHG